MKRVQNNEHPIHADSLLTFLFKTMLPGQNFLKIVADHFTHKYEYDEFLKKQIYPTIRNAKIRFFNEL